VVADCDCDGSLFGWWLNESFWGFSWDTWDSCQVFWFWLVRIGTSDREVGEGGSEIAHHVDIALGWARWRCIATRDGLFVSLGISEVG
jgi:hypothetical protein